METLGSTPVERTPYIFTDIDPVAAEEDVFTPEQVCRLLPLETARTIDRLQRDDADDHDGTPSDEWIPTLESSAPNVLAYAERNYSGYSDLVEEELEKDPILSKLLEVREHFRSSESFSRIVRIRRTVAVRILAAEAHEESAAQPAA